MRSAIATGVVLAAIAALAFGATAPVIAWAGRDIGPLTTAALLYAGAALVAVALRKPRLSLRRADFPRLVTVAIAGGAIAPTLLAWGLQRAGATIGALLLNLEAVFTVALAWLVYREPIGRRIVLAVACMVAGGAALVLDASTAGGFGLFGALAVAGATLAWAADNTWTRPLAERDPWDVVLVKGALGATLTAAVAIARGEALPAAAPALILLVCGATGYGASLRLYLLAQRRIGAARTGSVFALAPFIGAALAWAIGDRHGGAGTLAAVALFGAGVVLHVTERHAHGHVHVAIDHDHVHRHDDGHHDHVHDPPVVGEHAHPHHHDHLEHTHEHALDPHHDHH
jgi:drug/metabolite transporter (DMT)-like permease